MMDQEDLGWKGTHITDVSIYLQKKLNRKKIT